ncbi:phosphatidylinositol-specific phospholipase C [Streptococcus suis]|uniref:phosphatidylinositol-specific phospholipase C n=1 Tax=Streptococcus suis TaxID=1307 RepID=UPI0038BD67F0
MNTKKKISFALTACLGLFLLFPTSTHAHYDRAFWYEEQVTTPHIEQYTDWMSTIPDNRFLGELAIPGTHDSMAHSNHLPFRDIVRTQTMNLQQQLESGIRYLDIRLAYMGDHFALYHGSIALGYQFEEVLTTIQNYLISYPSETILMRIKQEHTHASDPEMFTLFESYYQRYSSLFWNTMTSSNGYNPTLGEIRGQIVLLPDVLSIEHGINYRFVITQDQYHLNTNWDLYKKWEAIKNHINQANTSSIDFIFMNYLSGSGGSFPYFVASGHVRPATDASRLSTGLTEPGFRHRYPDFPRTARLGVFATISFEGTNTLVADYLRNNQIRRPGIIISDFPGERLINEVIQCNYR